MIADENCRTAEILLADDVEFRADEPNGAAPPQSLANIIQPQIGEMSMTIEAETPQNRVHSQQAM